jgi:DNA-binding transcriptional LysR family regulator
MLVNKHMAIIAATGVLGVLSLLSTMVCARFQKLAEEDALMKNRAQVDCLYEESHRLADCHAALSKHPVDYDFCDAAVAACRQNGFYRTASDSWSTLETWRLWTIRSRIAVLILAAALIGEGVAILATWSKVKLRASP